MGGNFRFVTAIWGADYVDKFVRITLPTLLAPQNLPKIARDSSVFYTIVTRRQDAALMNSSAVIDRLRAVAEVEFVTPPSELFNGNPHEAHARAWDTAELQARESGEMLVFIAPDAVFADGALSAMTDALLWGKSAVFVFFHRVTEETFLPDVKGLMASEATMIAIPPRQLARLALQHLSPLACCYLNGSNHVPKHAELAYYSVPGEGLILRSIHTHVWAFNPARIKLNKSYVPDRIDRIEDVVFLADSDVFMAVSLTPIDHQISWFYDLHQWNATCVAAFGAQWYSEATNYLWRMPFLVHDGDMTPALWAQEIRKTDRWMERCFIATKVAYQRRANFE